MSLLKKILIALGIVLAIYVLNILILLISAICLVQKPMPIFEMPKELKELEKEIQKEVRSNEINFDKIPKHEMENCKTELSLHLYIYNDSITKSEKSIYNYVESISQRLNRKLIHKNCIDSLIIKTSPSINNGGKRYSFPIK